MPPSRVDILTGVSGVQFDDAWPRRVALDLEVVHFDVKTGTMLGRVPGRSHQLGIGFDGSIYPATRGDTLIVYRPKK